MVIELANSVLNRLEREDPAGENAAAVAATVLQEMVVPSVTATHFDDLLVDCCRAPDSVRGLLNPRFGEPSLVLAESPNWTFEVIYWWDMVTAIHEHSYPGAFCTIHGDRFQLEFAFVEGELIESHTRTSTGDLCCIRVELLRPGTVVRILPFEQFIHMVWPISRPSFTTVVRMRRQGASRSYLPGGLRFDEHYAEAEVLPRLRYLEAARRRSPRIYLRALDEVTSDLAAASLTYLTIAQRIEPSDGSVWAIVERRASRFGSAFTLRLRAAAEHDRVFRAIYPLRVVASSALEQTILLQLYAGSVVDEDQSCELASLTRKVRDDQSGAEAPADADLPVSV
jgi:hypothetical protein